jgi:hypothetical protein
VDQPCCRTRHDGRKGHHFQDTGTHADPVTGATVSNTGVYQYSTGWQWMASTLASDAAAQVVLATAQAAIATARLGDFQNTIANAIGYTPEARRYVGITSALVGAPSDSGNANGWHLPPQAWPMIYDSISLYMTASGTGRLVIWTQSGSGFRRAEVVGPFNVAAGFQTLALLVYVPAGGTISFEQVTGGNLMLSGYSASPSQNGWLPINGALGDLAASTASSADYGFGASGYAIEEAPAQLRTAAEARSNQRSYPAPKQYIIGTWLPAPPNWPHGRRAASTP